MVRSKAEYWEYLRRCEAAYQKWAKDKKLTPKEFEYAYFHWHKLVDQELIDRTRHSRDDHLKYPYSQDFVFRSTPTETVNRMIIVEHIPTLYVVG